ncbi:MAG: hypothetical protein APF77_23440 [Clostridia bacterium BRH_c25]|nr:MAG: hypothetical protein APF77_23440 [Clostridia bacterium BRH_c25]
MKKQYAALPIFLCILILCSSFTAFAENSGQIVLTLEEAQRRALENSLEYSRQDDKINDSLENYYDTAESTDKAYGKASSGFYDYFMKPVNLETSLQSSVNDVKSARFKKEDMKRVSDYNVLKAFINIKKAQYNLEDAKNNSSIKSKEYEAAKVKYGMDLIKKSELRQAEAAYNNTVDAVTTALKSLQKEMQTLNRYLGRELTAYNLQLVIDLPDIDITTINLDELRKDYISSSEDLYNLSLKAELAKRKYDLTKERYDEFVVRLSVQNSRDQMEEAFDDAFKEYESARKSFEDATIDLDISLSTSYDALKSAAESIADLQEEIELSKSDAEKARIQYDMGLTTKINMEKAIMELDTLNNKLKSSIADLNLQYEGLMMYSE